MTNGSAESCIKRTYLWLTHWIIRRWVPQCWNRVETWRKWENMGISVWRPSDEMGGHISERQNSDIFKEASFYLSRPSWYTYSVRSLTFLLKNAPNILNWAQSKMIVEKPMQCAQFILDSVSDPFLILTLKVSAIIKARIIPHPEISLLAINQTFKHCRYLNIYQLVTPNYGWRH